MAIDNKKLKIFGENNSTTIGEFGSAAPSGAGFVQTNDIDNIQTTKFENGYVFGDKPQLRDIASAVYVATYGTSMIQRQGAVLPYLPDVNYNINAPVLDSSDAGQIYYSLINDNIGNALTDITKWRQGKNIFESVEISTFKKYSVNSSAVDINGNASFINKVSDSEISFNVDVLNPLIYSFANGNTQTLESLANVSGISGDGDYVVLIEEGSLAVVVVNKSLNSVDEDIILPTGVDGDYFTTINPLKSYKKVGGSWIETNYVKLGGFAMAGGVIGTPYGFALNRTYVSEQISFTNNNPIDISHNLGLKSQFIREFISVINIDPEYGYVPGETLMGATNYNASSVSSGDISLYTLNSAFTGINTCVFRPTFTTSDGGIRGMTRNSNTYTGVINVAKWRLVFSYTTIF